jgi:serine protease Do
MLDTEARGVVVVDVRRGSPAQRLGLQPGDVLMRLNDREIKATDDARRVASVPLPWRLQVRRGERVIQIVVGR